MLDPDTGTAPEHIITKREGNDLLFAFDEQGEHFSLTIKNFYDSENHHIIGKAEDGLYHFYIPDSGLESDYVTKLVLDETQGQALGNATQETPFYQFDDGFNYLPWLLGGLGALAGVGALAAGLYFGLAADEPQIDLISKNGNPTGKQENHTILR